MFSLEFKFEFEFESEFRFESAFKFIKLKDAKMSLL